MQNLTREEARKHHGSIRTYVCVHCGKEFEAFRERKYCSRSCAKHHNTSIAYKQVKVIDNKSERSAMMERLHQRDLEYARKFPNQHHIVKKDLHIRQDGYNELMRRFY